jgi:DNA-binding transcriptional regulator YiaG
VNIGQKIRKKREREGLTQKALALRWNIPWNTVARWERGERTPTGLYLTMVEKWLTPNQGGSNEG